MLPTKSDKTLPKVKHMRTVPLPDQPWARIDVAPGRFAPTRTNGKRTPGWEDLNVTLLADEIGVSFRYLLGVLQGQRNCTLALLQRVAQALGISLNDLINRMEHAYHLRATAVPRNKNEIRRNQTKRRALTWNRRSR